MTTPTLRGRAATPVRPGLVAKAVLLGEVPLATGEYVQEAAINDLHSAYKELVSRENALRPHAKRLRPMTAQSFKTLFKFAQLLNLVELVREEPPRFPPPGGNLLSIRRPDGELNAHVVISMRRIFRLSAVGAEDEKSWTNLCRAWIEKWPAPQKAEYLPPVFEARVPREPKEKVVKEKPPKAAPEFTPYVWRDEFTPSNLNALAKHLEKLESLGPDTPDIAEEISTLSGKIAGWIIEADEALDEVRPIGFASEIKRFEGIISSLTQTREALMDYDLIKAISNLKGLAIG